MLGGRAAQALVAMNSSRLVPESQLLFCAELAAAIGLEEAVLLQQLKGLYRHQPATRRDGVAWLHISHAYLLDLLPFWDLPALLRLCDGLERIGLLRVDRGNAARYCLLIAIDEPPAAGQERVAAPAPATMPAAPPAAPAAAVARREAPAAPRRGEGEPLSRDFQPSEDMLELLERFHGVPRGFALAQLEDFTLYWRERGSAGHAWQNKFKQHVQFQWARYQQEQSGTANGEQRGTGAARRTRDSSLEHDLTDTSWAE